MELKSRNQFYSMFLNTAIKKLENFLDRDIKHLSKKLL